MRALLRAAALALVLAGANAATAQDTIPRDTTRRPVPGDTIRRLPAPGRDTVKVAIPEEAVRADTLPDRPRADTLPPDSTVPAPSFPEFPELAQAGFGPGVWIWGPQELARWHGLSLEDFFDRIPGLVTTRSGSFGRPAGASPYGGGGGRVRIYLDGWELRAMNGGTPDLQRVPLSDVTALRIERRLGEVRVDISTFRLRDKRPYAQIEGADGDFDTRILRPFFASTVGSRMVLQLGMDLVETDGFRRAENFGANTPFVRLSYLLRPELGLQLDYRTTAWSLDESSFNGNNLPGEQLDRSELMLRGRGRFGALWVDGAVGRTAQSPAENDSLVADLQSTQAYVRAAVDLGVTSVVGTARIHQGEENSWAPDERELGASVYFNPGAGLSAGGDLRHRTLGGESGIELEGWARAALGRRLAVFGSIAAGDRPTLFVDDTTRKVITIGGGGGLPGLDSARVPIREYLELVPSLQAIRAGAEWTGDRWAAGAAFVVHDLDQVAAYGSYFDAGVLPDSGHSIQLVEVYGSVPILYEGLRVEGWFMKRLDDAQRRFTPDYMGRAALEFHDSFRGGNLEPTVRLEVVGRSRAPLPAGSLLTNSTRYSLFNAFVQIRILDIRLFWRMENIFNERSALDVDDYARLPGARQVYGVRWFFRN